MNKVELIQCVAERTAMPQNQVKKCLDAILGTVGDELRNGREVVFLCIRTSARRNRLPDGRWTIVPVKERVRFKAFTNIRSYSVKYF